MAIVMIYVIPLGTADSSVSKYVARAVKILKEEKVKYEATAMGTTMEGDLDELLRVCKKMHDSVFCEEVSRVVTILRIDDRRDKPSTIQSKMTSLNKQLGQ